MNSEDSTVTLTFCECAENHVGMQQLGTKAADGFSIAELKEIKTKFEKAGPYGTCQLIQLRLLLDEKLRKDTETAAILVIRGGVDLILGAGQADQLATEMFGLEWDKKKFDKGKVMNKKARHNLTFGEENQEADFEAKKGTVIAYDQVPVCAKLRETLPKWFGEKSREMKCEGNAYYDWKECYILPHGDGERRRVIGVRLGHTLPLFYQWYLGFQPVSEKREITLNHGDIYIMSEKAVGTDWKRSSIYTLRHSAGLEETLVKHQRKKKKK